MVKCCFSICKVLVLNFSISFYNCIDFIFVVWVWQYIGIVYYFRTQTVEIGRLRDLYYISFCYRDIEVSLDYMKINEDKMIVIKYLKEKNNFVFFKIFKIMCVCVCIYLEIIDIYNFIKC